MKQTLTSTHVVLVLSLLYLPYAIIVTVRQRGMTERNIVAICSLCAIFPPLILSLFQYYSGEHNVADYGDLFFFIFIAIYAIHVSISLRKDINTGREAALYRELAEKDLLTGCYNRNAYRNDSSECTDLSDTLLVACDLNNLKRCNDTLGHAYGDKYLVDSANILKEVFSSYGKVYRIGGDEFCIVIPNRKQCHIHTLIATLLERELIYNADAELIKLEIACGYAEYDPAIDTKMDDILNRADALMYENKKELKKAAGE
jgi:diguanylate cyclase (GGDEF)-like protein